MSLLKSLFGSKLKPAKEKPHYKPFTFDIMGMNYCKVEKAATTLKGYNMTTEEMSRNAGKHYYKYWFDCKDIKLVPEPKNKADKNAIMVKVNGVKVGYVPASDTAKVRRYLAWPCDITAEILGGPSRVYFDGRIYEDTRGYRGTVTISIK